MPDINTFFTQPTQNEAATIAAELVEMCNNGVKQLIDIHQMPFNKLWRRTQEMGIDPQDVLDALGDKGEKMFTLASELVAFILGAYGNTPIAKLDPSEYTPPFNYTIVDGRIVLIK